MMWNFLLSLKGKLSDSKNLLEVSLHDKLFDISECFGANMNI